MCFIEAACKVWHYKPLINFNLNNLIRHPILDFD